MVVREHPRLGGFTLIELMITVALTGVFLTSLSGAVQRSVGLYRQTSGDLQLERSMERASHRLREELVNAGATTLTPVPVVVPGGPVPWSDSLQFRQVESWAANNVAFGSFASFSTRLEGSELDDGIDQDGDGLVDERELILTLDVGGAGEQVVVVAGGILEWFPGEFPNGADDNGNGLEDEPGLSFVLDGDEVTVRLALGEPDSDGAVAVRTRTLLLSLHN